MQIFVSAVHSSVIELAKAYYVLDLTCRLQHPEVRVDGMDRRPAGGIMG